jgi:dihydroorotate dehydrogenase
MKFLISLLRLLPPEIAHSVALKSLNIIYKLNLVPFLFPFKGSSSTFSYKNLIFKNRLGIAAGLDKNGDYIDSLGALGFGFIEVGTVTPLPQEGNPKPRIFRFPFEQALINRLGFNNKGLDCLIRNLRSRKFSGIVGVNIGSNKNSEGQKRIDDYVECIEKISPYADYITINISSPNTPNLRALHAKENLIPLFSAIKLAIENVNYLNPVFIKISPDEAEETILNIILAIKDYAFDGVIASNTTIDRTELNHISGHNIAGGLSGRPLFKKSTDLLKKIHKHDQGLVKIGVGGVFNSKDYKEKLESGASLVQIYTSFIYEGPQIVSKLLQ